jgi:hypothetical protein
MTHKQNYDFAQGDGPQSLPVRFEFIDANAGSVYIAGTFNNWQPDAKPMHPVGNCRWVRETILPIGTYEYCLVVDGKFRPDPRAPETVENPFVGRASILKVMSEPEPLLGFGQNFLQPTRKNK